MLSSSQEWCTHAPLGNSPAVPVAERTAIAESSWQYTSTLVSELMGNAANNTVQTLSEMATAVEKTPAWPFPECHTPSSVESERTELFNANSYLIKMLVSMANSIGRICLQNAHDMQKIMDHANQLGGRESKHGKEGVDLAEEDQRIVDEANKIVEMLANMYVINSNTRDESELEYQELCEATIDLENVTASQNRALVLGTELRTQRARNSTVSLCEESGDHTLGNPPALSSTDRANLSSQIDDLKVLVGTLAEQIAYSRISIEQVTVHYTELQRDAWKMHQSLRSEVLEQLKALLTDFTELLNRRRVAGMNLMVIGGSILDRVDETQGDSQGNAQTGILASMRTTEGSQS